MKNRIIISIFCYAIPTTIILSCIFLCNCSSRHLADGWYPIADTPDNKIEGKAIVTVKEFADITLDTTSTPDLAIIVGHMKADKVKKWSKATEDRIGKRVGFVFNDSVITAPQVNCRIESGSFSINSLDRQLIFKIFESISHSK